MWLKIFRRGLRSVVDTTRLVTKWELFHGRIESWVTWYVVLVEKVLEQQGRKKKQMTQY